MIEDKDLGLKIGTELEAEWKKVLDSSKKNKLSAQIESEIHAAIIELANKRIEEESDKLK